MKKLSIILVLFLGIFAQNLNAQVAKDSKGHFLINSKGDVYIDGVKAGFISKDNIIKNNEGKKLGFINPDGSVSNSEGKKIGKVGKDGTTYYNANGEVILSVQNSDSETCNILDAKGNVIGNVHNSYKKTACALHCFQNQMDMKKHEKAKKHAGEHDKKKS